MNDPADDVPPNALLCARGGARLGRTFAFHDREIIEPLAFLVEESRIEPVAVHVDYERAQPRQRDEHRGMVEKPARGILLILPADLAGAPGHDVNRAFMHPRPERRLAIRPLAVRFAVTGI